MNEKSLRLGTAADEQFSEFVEPKDVFVDLIVSTNASEAVVQDLACKFANFLIDEGYSKVTLSNYMGHPIALHDHPAPRDLAAAVQGKVNINLKLT